MKTFLLVLLCALVVTSPLAAQLTLPPDPYRTGALTGMLIDVVGYGLFVGGGSVSSLDLGVGLTLLAVGTVTMTGGGLWWNVALDSWHGAVKTAGGTAPDAEKAKAWLLEWITVGCTGGAVVVGFTGLGGDAAPWIALGLAGASAITEIINAFGARSAWARALATTGVAAADPPAVLPAVAVSAGAAPGTLSLLLNVDIRLPGPQGRHRAPAAS